VREPRAEPAVGQPAAEVAVQVGRLFDPKDGQPLPDGAEHLFAGAETLAHVVLSPSRERVPVARGELLALLDDPRVFQERADRVEPEGRGPVRGLARELFRHEEPSGNQEPRRAIERLAQRVDVMERPREDDRVERVVLVRQEVGDRSPDAAGPGGFDGSRVRIDRAHRKPPARQPRGDPAVAAADFQDACARRQHGGQKAGRFVRRNIVRPHPRRV
jgi:hypothetical protein